MNKARVIAITKPIATMVVPDADALIPYCARVSNPENQENHDTGPRLMHYCAKHKHWSVFEMASVVLEIETSRDIARQLLRHRSFHFQETSQRYSHVDDFVIRELRLQDTQNRQASLPCDNPDWHKEWASDLEGLLEMVEQLRDTWRERGVAKEVLRVMYPEGLTMSRLYISATLRDLWHYCELRRGNGTQPEHADLAEKIAAAVKVEVPDAWAALEASREAV